MSKTIAQGSSKVCADGTVFDFNWRLVRTTAVTAKLMVKLEAGGTRLEAHNAGALQNAFLSSDAWKQVKEKYALRDVYAVPFCDATCNTDGEWMCSLMGTPFATDWWEIGKIALATIAVGLVAGGVAAYFKSK